MMMKRILLIVFCLSVTTPCIAAPCYSTRMPKEKGFSTGVQTHAIFKRYLEESQGKVRSFQHFWFISYGLFDWLSIDLKGGAGSIKQRPEASDEVDYPSAFAGGYGLRLKCYENEKTKIVFGLHHISVHPKKIKLGDIKHISILDEWQMSLLGSYSFSKLTPYLGMKWSRVDYIHWVDENRKRVMSDLTNDLGLVFGLDFSITETCWINLEGQLFDGDAMAASINFDF